MTCTNFDFFFFLFNHSTKNNIFEYMRKKNEDLPVIHFISTIKRCSSNGDHIYSIFHTLKLLSWKKERINTNKIYKQSSFIWINRHLRQTEKTDSCLSLMMPFFQTNGNWWNWNVKLLVIKENTLFSSTL